MSVSNWVNIAAIKPTTLVLISTGVSTGGSIVKETSNCGSMAFDLADWGIIFGIIGVSFASFNIIYQIVKDKNEKDDLRYQLIKLQEKLDELDK